jgi:hypothetical protein
VSVAAARFLAAAYDDVESAYLWYERRHAGLGAGFSCSGSHTASSTGSIATASFSSPVSTPHAIRRWAARASTTSLETLRRYFYVGGMPASVSTYAAGLSLQTAFTRQDAMVQSYRDDFGKRAPSADKRCLDEVLVATASSVGGWGAARADPHVRRPGAA